MAYMAPHAYTGSLDFTEAHVCQVCRLSLKAHNDIYGKEWEQMAARNKVKWGPKPVAWMLLYEDGTYAVHRDRPRSPSPADSRWWEVLPLEIMKGYEEQK